VAIEDIYGARWDIALRHGWHELESHGGAFFRWARNNAECALFTFEPACQRVSFDLEPGPSAAAPAFTLIVFDSNGERKLTEDFTGRKTVSFTVTARRPTVHVLRLHVPGAGRLLASEPRVLDFRVYRIGLEPEPNDVVAVASGCRVGDAWNPVEHWDGLRFRWVENDARIIVDADEATVLELDLEPGPGMGGEPLTLRAHDGGGRTLGSYCLGSRQRIAVPLPPELERPFDVVLHCDGGGIATAGETRVLNFRAFCEPE
jgi:hypothetical protein